MNEVAPSPEGAPVPPALASDPYAAAKANLRDTIKWLTTSFAALAAGVLAGSPLTGLGSLPLGGRLVIAVAGAVLGLVFVFRAIFVALRLLASGPFFLSQLAQTPDLLKFIEAHERDLLPPQLPTLTRFLEERNRIIEIIRTKYTAQDDEYKRAVQVFPQLDYSSGQLLNLAHFELLRQRLVKESHQLLLLAVGAMVALIVFAWAANPPKESTVPLMETQLAAPIELEFSSATNPLLKGIAETCRNPRSAEALIRSELASGWVSIEVEAPTVCRGLRVKLPAGLRAVVQDIR